MGRSRFDTGMPARLVPGGLSKAGSKVSVGVREEAMLDMLGIVVDRLQHTASIF